MSSNPENNTALAVRDKAPVAIGQQGLQIQSLEELWRFAQFVAKSPFAPKDFDSPEAIVVAVQYGYELGLTPMQALQNIAVINGKPSIYGDAMLALVRASGLLEDFEERYEGDGDEYASVCTVKRLGAAKPRTERFSVKMAKRAGLWGKSGPWSTAPERMLRFRARGFALRDEFGDVLKGLVSVEEAEDYDLIMGGGHRVEATGAVVEMPERRTRTEQLKDRLRTARPETKAAMDAQAPLPGVAGDEHETAIDAEEVGDDETEAAEVLSTEQANQLVALADENGLDEGHLIDLAAEFGATEVRLIPAVCFDEAYERVLQVGADVKAAAATAADAVAREVATLRDMAEAAAIDVAAFLKQFKAASFEKLTEAQRGKARQILEARLAKQGS